MTKDKKRGSWKPTPAQKKKILLALKKARRVLKKKRALETARRLFEQNAKVETVESLMERVPGLTKDEAQALVAGGVYERLTAKDSDNDADKDVRTRESEETFALPVWNRPRPTTLEEFLKEEPSASLDQIFNWVERNHWGAKPQFKDNRGGDLYLKFAISGLLAMDASIKRVADESKTSHCSFILAMYNERKKLVLEDRSYWEAFEFLRDLANRNLLFKMGELFIAKPKASDHEE